MSHPSSLLLIMTTFAQEESAIIVLRTLLEERLIACGTILPQALSLYVWEGEIVENREVIVWIKTSLRLLSSCMERLQELHPYTTPELLVLQPNQVGAPYLAWLHQVLGEDPSSLIA